MPGDEQEMKQRERGWPDSSDYYPKYHIKMAASVRGRTSVPPT